VADARRKRMAKKRIPMRKIKETLRLVHEVGLSQ